LETNGWTIRTAWTPSHTGIKGNEKADHLAKLGAEEIQKCQHATTSKLWMLAEVRRSFFSNWKNELPHAYPPSFKYPTELQNLKPKTAAALARLQCGRTPCDPLPYTENPPLCKCGQTTLTSLHLLTSCPLYDLERFEAFHKCYGLPSDEGFLFNLKNITAITKFMAKTRIGYTTNPSAPHQEPHCNSDGESETHDNNHTDIAPFTLGATISNESPTITRGAE
jgi:hypothetical protein